MAAPEYTDRGKGPMVLLRGLNSKSTRHTKAVSGTLLWHLMPTVSLW